MLLVKEKFKISVLIIIICIICQVTRCVALSNVKTVKMFFFFNVNFTKSTVELHVYCITSMLVKFQNDQRSIARYSIKFLKLKFEFLF